MPRFVTFTCLCSKSLTSCSIFFSEPIIFFKLNSNIHAYNTQRKRDIHIQSYKTDVYKKSVINMGSKLYNKLPDYIKETESYKTFKKQLK